MILRLLSLVALILAATSARAIRLDQQPPGQPVFRAGVDAVAVDVSVQSADRPVSGLKAGDFQLRDNGVVQQIDVSTIEAVPVDVSIVVDTSFSVLPNIDKFRADVRRFPAMLRPMDRIRLVTFAYGARELVPMQPPPKTLAIDRIAAGVGTSLNDAVLFAVLPEVVPGRRHLVIMLTDGVDTTSAVDAADLPAIALRSGAILHVVLRRTAGLAGRPPRTESEVAIEAASAQTGGRQWELTAQDDIARVLSQVFEHFKQNYLLTYVPKGVPRGGWHDVSVEVPGVPGAKIVARKGYFGS